ncbi:hypothetical protein BDN70DRAFT_346657 [Pholiota conissans]|uniref:Uncharacterized protein n=1 Tax=Pholiota conissans TaxID=109636 RepID=A0A9P5YQI4_9AGAR|nr:hypothetical protein BDN70DRAFT_346657 [Pholiota conissans]
MKIMSRGRVCLDNNYVVCCSCTCCALRFRFLLHNQEIRKPFERKNTFGLTTHDAGRRPVLVIHEIRDLNSWLGF